MRLTDIARDALWDRPRVVTSLVAAGVTFVTKRYIRRRPIVTIEQ